MRDLLNMNAALDNLMGDMMTQSSRWGGLATPEIDMYQTNNEVVVKAAIPGIMPEDLQISVVGDVLNLRGELKEEKVESKTAFHIKERRYGVFSRSIQLPVPIQSDKANAEFENGILTLTLPKAEEIRPKTISVKVK
jgi:HSP20 family protein